MHFLGRLFVARRLLAGGLLLAALLAGEVADAYHHLGEHGCAAEAGGRDDNCTCASLHASPIASEARAQAAVGASEHEFSPMPVARPEHIRAASAAAPRAPPGA